MSRLIDPSDIRWERYPSIAGDPLARKWLESQVLLGLAQNTIEAYARGVQDFMEYCVRSDIHAQQATRDELARYVGTCAVVPVQRAATSWRWIQEWVFPTPLCSNG